MRDELRPMDETLGSADDGEEAPPLADDAAPFLRAAGGDRAALDAAVAEVYGELRRLAHAEAQRSRDALFQPTALVHETYLRLQRQRSGGWSDRGSFLAIASGVMRRVLVDQARAAGTRRRGEGRLTEDVETARVQVEDECFDVLLVDDLLVRLAEVGEEEARTAELIAFGGLTIEETARALGISKRTVDRRWRFARAWLARALDPANGEGAT